ncbi:MAG: hypothetical protein R3B39_00105 [Candidatus Paceibacterota bacterium]
MWKKLETLREKVRVSRKIYTYEHERQFLSFIETESGYSDTSLHLGLYKNQPEFKELSKNRLRYFKALYRLREMQRAMFFFEDVDMNPEEIDDIDIWDMKMKYKLGINKKNFFSYYPEYIRSVFGIKTTTQTKNPA